MEDLIEDELTEIVIDFTGLDGSEERLQEFFWQKNSTTVWAKKIEIIMKRLFGQNAIPVSVKGTPSQLSSFANALGNEKRYIQTARDLGLDDPRTTRNRSRARWAAREFRRQTGIEWPFH